MAKDHITQITPHEPPAVLPFLISNVASSQTPELQHHHLCMSHGAFNCELCNDEHCKVEAAILHILKGLLCCSLWCTCTAVGLD
jgi:hypothetical protein